MDSRMQIGNVSNVFDHHANPENVAALRGAVVDDIASLHDRYSHLLSSAGAYGAKS